MPGRLTIGLYNSYDSIRFGEAHRRALARAGPLALAFDCNLATFGFPFDNGLSTPTEICEWVASTTSIGERGKYLMDLAGKGRYSSFGFPKKGFPPQLGWPVITTRKPARGLSVDPCYLRETLESGQSLLLVFGLGPRGLPKKVFDMGRSHLDVTGQGLSLETCTAMGAVVCSLAGR
ncbi:MAG: DUF531 family protein [Methanobacteriota archaeon]|nr:MAG: DUF531 family protein [Euryarchaeota archaeon]